MSRRIALVRAINIPGRAVRMAELRSVLADAGYRDVETYIQTGNVVLEVGRVGPATVAGAVADAVERLCGYRPAVVMRTPRQLADVLTEADRSPAIPGELKRYVTFLNRSPAAAGIPRLVALSGPAVSVRVVGDEAHWQASAGSAALSVSNETVESLLQAAGTTRDLTVVRAMVQRWC